MRRRVRWIVLVVVLLVAGVIAAGLLISPDISDARDRVDTRWTALRTPLAARYEALAAVSSVMHDAGGGERAVTQELDIVLGRWAAFEVRGPTHTDAAAEARIANELEALARRLEANIVASARLSVNTVLTDALNAFKLVVVPEPDIQQYNRAVRAYERERSGVLNRLVCAALGYDSRPLLVVG
jgi:hypothetical protein